MVLQLSWPSAAALAVAAVLFAVLAMRVADEAMAARIELPSLVPMLFTLVGFLVVALGCGDSDPPGPPGPVAAVPDAELAPAEVPLVVPERRALWTLCEDLTGA